MKPLIGLVGDRFTGSRITGNLDVLGASPIDVFYADYSSAVLEAGGLPVWIPLDVDPADVGERVDAVLMTGGTDIDPALYRAEPGDDLLDHSAVRDAFELSMLDAALAAKKPVLGICRGVQIINVWSGGTLHQHVPSHAFVDGPADDLVHDVAMTPGSVVGDCYGPVLRVNSLHHQAVDELGDRLVVTGTAPDGGVEAIEHLDAPMVAVQWHPEMLPTRRTDPIFSWLVETASEARIGAGAQPTSRTA